MTAPPITLKARLWARRYNKNSAMHRFRVLGMAMWLFGRAHHIMSQLMRPSYQYRITMTITNCGLKVLRTTFPLFRHISLLLWWLFHNLVTVKDVSSESKVIIINLTCFVWCIPYPTLSHSNKLTAKNLHEFSNVLLLSVF